MGNEVRMMAKYSMEISEMIENPLTPLFHFDYDFYCDDQLVKKKFEQKFIDHYFFYEIGCETHARWSQMLKARLNLIMPYYKQLYETELKSKNIEFLLNKDYTETFIRELDRTNQDMNQVSGSTEVTMSNQGTTTDTKNSTNTSKSSSLNDGVVSASLEHGYLTQVGEEKGQLSSTTTSDDSSESHTTNSQSLQSNGEMGERESHTIIGKGNIGTTSSAELLSKWRGVLINIDRLIIDECKDLFMLIY